MEDRGGEQQKQQSDQHEQKLNNAQPHWISVNELESLLAEEVCNIETDLYEIQTVNLRELMGVDGFLAILNGQPFGKRRGKQQQVDPEPELEPVQFVRHTDNNVYVWIPLQRIFDIVNDNGLSYEIEDGQNA
jgi:hypothetical protein